MEGGKEQNYWPGFVDVLSNVVLTLVFVLVVFVMALSLSANKIEKKMQEIIQDKKNLEEKNAELKVSESKICAGTSKQQIDNIVAPEKNIEIESTESTKIEDASVEAKIIKSSEKIIIYYPTSGINLDEKSSANLEKTLKDIKQKIGTVKIILHSYLGKEQYSVAQRLAYYRALYVRKFLIEKEIASGNMIHSKILQIEKKPAEQSVGHVEIIFQGN